MVCLRSSMQQTIGVSDEAAPDGHNSGSDYDEDGRVDGNFLTIRAAEKTLVSHPHFLTKKRRIGRR